MRKFDLDIPKMGYFILYQNDGTFVGNSIEKYQRKYGFNYQDSRFTHIEVSGGGPYAISVGPPFTRLINICEKWEGKYIKIVRYKDQDACYGKEYWRKTAKVAFWSATKSNLFYDFRGVLSFALPLIKHSKDLNFCSENAIYSLRKEFPEALGTVMDHRVMPAHFLSSEFCVVWEGYLRC